MERNNRRRTLIKRCREFPDVMQRRNEDPGMAAADLGSIGNMIAALKHWSRSPEATGTPGWTTRGFFDDCARRRMV